MKLIPDFASMTDGKCFQYLKFGIVRLFVLWMAGMGTTTGSHPSWLNLTLTVVVFALVCHAAIATDKCIRSLEQRSKQKTVSNPSLTAGKTTENGGEQEHCP